LAFRHPQHKAFFFATSVFTASLFIVFVLTIRAALPKSIFLPFSFSGGGGQGGGGGDGGYGDAQPILPIL